MKQFIYKSDFNSGPDATKKQQILFEADLEYAVSEGYEFIQMNNGTVFTVIEDEGKVLLAETEVTEEELQILAAEAEQSEFDPDEGDVEDSYGEEVECNYCIQCHNLMLIDGIINNTLTQKAAITPQQADTMLKLAKLKEMLGD